MDWVRIDWTLTGALAGVGLLAAVVGYEFVVVARSDPEAAKDYHAPAVLIPSRDRPAVSTYTASNTPAIIAYAPALQPQTPALQAYSPAQQGNPTQASNTTGYPQYPMRVEPQLPFGSRPNDHLPPPDFSNNIHNQSKPAPQPPQIGVDTWKIQTTSKASYFNLGGHVDKNGVVDSLASSYLRDALKKHRNYSKLPPQIQAYIEAPNIDLTKIADYHALLGMDEKRMEDEQGVRFIRIASSRSIDIDNPSTDEIKAPPLDLSSLAKLSVDLRRNMTLGSVP